MKTIRNPYKTKSVRMLGTVDPGKLIALVKEIPEQLWDQENDAKPNKFHELKDTKHIVFKFVHELNDCTDSYEFPIWQQWKDLVQPLLDQAVLAYGYPQGAFSRIMLAKLRAGGIIKAHKDGNEAATFPHKIHIPLVTNPKATFFVNPMQYHFETGNVYEVNNLAVHMAENMGTEDRIHLIFEYFNPGHLKEQNIEGKILDNSVVE